MINRRNVSAALVTFLIAFGLSTAAFADVPATMTYHGQLTDGAGQPVDTTVEATFHIYDAKTGGNEMWSEDFSTLDVNNGAFTAQLGSNQPLTGVFDGHQYWLEVAINGETLSPRTAIDSVPYALRANSANDADTVGGKTPADLTASVPTTAADLAYDNTASGMSATDVQAALDELAQLRARVDALEAQMKDANGAPINAADLDSRISQNTASISGLQTTLQNRTADISRLQSSVQANAVNISDMQVSVQNNTTAISSLQATTSGNTADISSLQTDLANNRSDIGANATDIQSNANAISINASGITTNANAISSNAGDISTNAADIAALQSLTQDMSRTTINGHPSVVFTGVNVHIRDGLGSTSGFDGTTTHVNGLGNLIIGYDEPRSSGSDKSGSHNLVVGTYNNYTSYGGLVVGLDNTISGTYASVCGGHDNTASGSSTSVSGGYRNTASNLYASVSGGRFNTASGYFSSISGGYTNTASQQDTSVLGGHDNNAYGTGSSITGGSYVNNNNNYGVMP